jgi:5-methyltetrahydrofolate--homocysteine methyltransferase
MSYLEEISKAVFDGDEAKTAELVQKAVDEGKDLDELLDKGLVQGLRDCGSGFEKGEKFIPEMLMSAEAMKAAMTILKPLMVANVDDDAGGHAVLATVEGDVHDIGLELVATMLETAGIKVYNMGPDVPTDDVIAAVKEHKPQILGLSALLSNTMDVMPEILERLEKEGLRDSLKVMIGGAPVKQDFCDEIGADGYAYDASSAVPKAKELLAQMKG